MAKEFTDKLHSQGMLRIHQKTEQLRYSPNGPTEGVDELQAADSFVQPLSYYLAGAEIKAGAPISIAVEGDDVGDTMIDLNAAIVSCRPSRHKWCIGLAQEPGAPVDYVDPIKRYVHALNNGKFTWYESEIKDKKKYVQFPPLTDKDRFVWTKADVGKQVFVSNKIGSEGQLTLELSEANVNGGNVITIGYLSDAPTANQTKNRKLTIEVRTAGDTRSMLDNTEFHAYVSSIDGASVVPNTSGNASKICCVKLLHDQKLNKTIARAILSNDDLLRDVENNPIAAFVAKSSADYNGKTIVVTRLGMIEGKFGFEPSDVGKELWLSNGVVSTERNFGLYEFRVGVVFDVKPEKQRVLIDCRSPKVLEGFEPVGKVKPMYGDNLTDPGYVAVDPEIEYYVRRPGGPDQTVPQYPDLARVAMSQRIAHFFDDKGDWIDVSNKAFADVDKPGYLFKFKEVFYKVGGSKIGAQIKFSKEGSPEEMHYVWPMKAYSLTLTRRSGDSAVLDVTDLMNLGDAWMGETNLDDFEVMTTVDDGSFGAGTVLSPGISRFDSDHYQGYEWQLVKKDGRSFLKMVTNPGTGVDDDACLGVVWPGFTRSLQVKCVVRRRPAFHSSLMLNQLYSDSSWNADVYSDGSNLGILGGIMFGSPVVRNDGTDAPYIDVSSANEFKIAKYKTVNDELVVDEMHVLGTAKPDSTSAVARSIRKLIDRRYSKGANGDPTDLYNEIRTTYDFKENTESHSAKVMFENGAELNGNLTIGPKGRLPIIKDSTYVIGTKRQSPDEVDFQCTNEDDSDKIQNAIDSLEATTGGEGGKIVLREGYYFLKKPIKIHLDSIMLEGFGAVLVPRSNLKEFIKITANKCLISNVSIEDNNPVNMTVECGIRIENCKYAAVEKCSIKLVRSENAVGIELKDAIDALVSNNDIDISYDFDASGYGFLIEGNATGSRITNNFVIASELAKSDGTTDDLKPFGSATEVVELSGGYIGLNSYRLSR